MANDHTIVSLPIRSVRIGSRSRKDLGDIDSLVVSINKVGLLQPLVITEGNNLLAGGRRLEACKRLGWKEVPCVIPHSGWSLIQMLEAERDENTCRKDFTPSESVAMGKAIEEKCRQSAKQEQQSALARGRRRQAERESEERNWIRKGEQNPIGETCANPKRDNSKRTVNQVAAAVGMSGRQYEKAKAVVESGNEKAIEQMDRTGKVDPAFKVVKRDQQLREQLKAAAEVSGEIGSVHVHHESFIETAGRMKPNSVSLIFTDPPYDTQSVPLYHDLAKVASRVLVDGGSLICYCGHRLVGKVMDSMSDSGLSYYWILACIHSGKSARMPLTGQVVTWKPMLWYVKGSERRDTSAMLNDSVQSTPPLDKIHKWQQGMDEALYYIERLTRPGEIVFDPFCGGGTTAVASLQLSRTPITCDIDAAAVAVASKRIMEAKRTA